MEHDDSDCFQPTNKEIEDYFSKRDVLPPDDLNEPPRRSLLDFVSRREKAIAFVIGAGTIIVILYVATHLVRNSFDAVVQNRMESLREDLRIMDARLRNVESNPPLRALSREDSASVDTVRPDSSS